MRICHIANHTGTGGAERAFKETVALLDCEQTTITLENFKGSQVRSVLFPWSSRLYHKIKKKLFCMGPDVVHLHNFKLFTWAAVAAAKSLKIPVVFSIYDYWAFCPKDTLLKNGETCTKKTCIRCYNPKKGKAPWFLKLPLLFRQAINNHFLKQIDRIIVLSRHSQEIVKSYGFDSVVVRQYCELKPKVNKLHNMVLFVGSLSPNKGVDVFIKAAEIVSKEGLGTKFCIIGPTAGNHVYLKGLDKSVVTFLGPKSHEEVQQYIAMSKVVVVPEQWPNMGPLIIQEAMSWGKPVVASNIGGIPEMIDQAFTGLLSESKRPGYVCQGDYLGVDFRI